ncbi:hypothetical protein DYB37_013240, partial [Aphanomyces astaci]
AGSRPTPNLEYTFRWLFEAVSVSAVSNQALLDRLDRTVRIEAALRVVLTRLLPNGPHTMLAALQRVNEEVESLGDALKQARDEREAEMALPEKVEQLREKVEQERDQANTERDKLEECVRGLRTELRTCNAKKYKELATRVENAIQAQLSSMADQVRELDRQQRSNEEEVAEVKKGTGSK